MFHVLHVVVFCIRCGTVATRYWDQCGHWYSEYMYYPNVFKWKCWTWNIYSMSGNKTIISSALISLKPKFGCSLAW